MLDPREKERRQLLKAARWGVSCLGEIVNDIDKQLKARAGDPSPEAAEWRRKAVGSRKTHQESLSALRKLAGQLEASPKSYTLPEPAGDDPASALAALYRAFLGRIRGTAVSEEEQAALDRARRCFAKHGGGDGNLPKG